MIFTKIFNTKGSSFQNFSLLENTKCNGKNNRMLTEAAEGWPMLQHIYVLSFPNLQ